MSYTDTQQYEIST